MLFSDSRVSSSHSLVIFQISTNEFRIKRLHSLSACSPSRKLFYFAAGNVHFLLFSRRRASERATRQPNEASEHKYSNSCGATHSSTHGTSGSKEQLSAHRTTPSALHSAPYCKSCAQTKACVLVARTQNMKKNQRQHVVFSTKKVTKRIQQQQATEATSANNAAIPRSMTTATGAVKSATTTMTTVEQTQDEQQSNTSARPSTPRMQRHENSVSITDGSSNSSSSTRQSTPRRSSPRRSSPHSQKRSKRSSSGSTKQRLQPATALLQSDQISVAQCVRSMVEKKTDATLLLDNNGLLTGILTDRVRYALVASRPLCCDVPY